MRAVRLHGVRDLRVEEVPAPAPPRPDEVMLDVTMAGICGSDLHNFATGAWITRAPSVAGHEFTGIVTRTGTGVSHVRAGDAVIVDSRHMCGHCAACAGGLGQVCESLGFLGEVMDGGFARAVVLPARNVLPAPEGVAPRHLAMAEPLAVALHAMNRLDMPAGAPLVIAGCGPIGALCALLAARAGHEVSLIERNPDRAGLVAAIAGARVITADDLKVMRPAHAIDTTGAGAVIALLVARIAGAGRLALVGIGRPGAAIDPLEEVGREITILGVHAFADELPAAGALLAELAPQLDALIAGPVGLGEVPAAYEALIAGQAPGIKTLIDCQR
ncbi:MAG: alcohol dehydrogenase catalytic domain-containing protein [Paracoccus sp. (in: a-proteobacteria)]|nr:alcohol dehydrogenase catalytic domain-containing protein [Paracoccus sp. (in: a-proteobacteria)]